MDEIYRQALELQHKLRDYLDQDAHPQARQLTADVQRLTDEIEMQKDPRTIEGRVKNIIRQLEAQEGSVMSHGHADDLRDRCFDMCQALRETS
jgi:hypothetical protein